MLPCLAHTVCVGTFSLFPSNCRILDFSGTFPSLRLKSVAQGHVRRAWKPPLIEPVRTEA